jgi:CRISPR-associated protein Csm5
LAWFRQLSDAQGTAGFYQQIPEADLPSNMCLVQLGWGTGWEDKTFGSHLQQDERFMEHIISSYRLSRGKRQPGDPFPRSRRVTVRVARDRQGRVRQQPSVPLGWALMEWKERKQK